MTHIEHKDNLEVETNKIDESQILDNGLLQSKRDLIDQRKRLSNFDNNIKDECASNYSNSTDNKNNNETSNREREEEIKEEVKSQDDSDQEDPKDSDRSDDNQSDTRTEVQVVAFDASSIRQRQQIKRPS